MPRGRFSNPEHTQLITSPGWSRLENVITAFEDAWRRGERPALAAYLTGEGAGRRALLRELVHVDLEFSLRSDPQARVEPYLRDYPELAADRADVVDLVAAEFDVRRRHHGGVTLEEFIRRFPDYREELRARLGAAVAETRYGPTPDLAGAPAAAPTVPGYEILGELGRGGMGVVYQAYDARLGREVAIKFLPPEHARDADRLERFRREARTASALNHPNISTVHALGDHDGRPFIVMEYIEGRTLGSAAAGGASLAELCRLLAQAARALAAAHAAGVVHRDVKPENIMVRPDGFAKVLDFGLARRLPTADHRRAPGARDTDPGSLLGTVAYMSPEQARGESAESASDVFALGVVLYQLATGKHPFDRASALATLHAISNTHPPAATSVNPDLPPAVDGLLAAMLHKDARLRPSAAEVAAALDALAVPAPAQPAAPRRPIINRQAELGRLGDALDSAEAGRGSFVCVAGEPGVGKTTLVERFLAGRPADRPYRLARGQCSDRLGGSEAYLPVLDGLANLLRGPDGPAAARLMRVVAPTWYARLATEGAIPAAAQPPPATFAPRAASQRAMVGEFVSLLREGSQVTPLVLFLEDVHWADAATVDLLAEVGRHVAGLRVLVVLTYRPAEVLLRRHPFHGLRLDLRSAGVSAELPLALLGRADVADYLELAFPGNAFPPNLARALHARTGGNPLFLGDLVRYLCDRGVIAPVASTWSLVADIAAWRGDLPDSVRAVTQRTLERVQPADRDLLAAAAVQGQEFDSAVLAEGLGRDAADVEERLQTLERVHGLIRLLRDDEFPDRSPTRRYAFVHTLYQEALYGDVTPARRAELAIALGRALEGRYRTGSPAPAAELARLYEIGRYFGRAAAQFGLAARSAAHVFAHREALELARRGLGLLGMLPEGPDRSALELNLQITIGLQLQVTEGYAAAGAEAAYTRARALCGEDAGPGALFSVLWGLWLCAKVRSDLGRARELADGLSHLADRLGEDAFRLQAHQALSVTTLCAGDPAAARHHMEAGAALYDPRRHHLHFSRFGQDPGVACLAFGAVALWLQGFPDQAHARSDEAVRLAHELSEPSSQALALHFAAMLHQLARNARAAGICAEMCNAIAAEHGYAFWKAGSQVLHGWALHHAHDPDGLARLQRGLRDWEATGSVTYQTYFLGLLAEALAGQGDVPGAARALDRALALVERTGERLYAAELHRLHGGVLLAGGKLDGAADEARAAFRTAVEVARSQQARSLELRATIDLVRLGLRTGKADSSREELAGISAWFTEGQTSPDLREAKALLESLA